MAWPDRARRQNGHIRHSPKCNQTVSFAAAEARKSGHFASSSAIPPGTRLDYRQGETGPDCARLTQRTAFMTLMRLSAAALLAAVSAGAGAYDGTLQAPSAPCAPVYGK